MCQKTKGNDNHQTPTSRRGATATTAKEFSEDLHPPIPSHPRIKYPVPATPYFDINKVSVSAMFNSYVFAKLRYWGVMVTGEIFKTPTTMRSDISVIL